MKKFFFEILQIRKKYQFLQEVQLILKCCNKKSFKKIQNPPEKIGSHIYEATIMLIVFIFFF